MTTNKQILDAINAQSKEIEKVESRLSARILEVKEDCRDDAKTNADGIKDANARIDGLQSRARTENTVGSILAAVLAFVGSLLVPR
jgi:vacuolar-type H+-ATPase subunit H